MKLFKKIISHRILLAFFSIVLQLSILLFLIYGLSVRISWIYIIFNIVGILLILYMTTNDSINPKYVQTWTLIILGLPFVGVVLYFLLGNSSQPKELTQRSKLMHSSHELEVVSDEENYSIETVLNSHWSKIIYFLEEQAHFPLYGNTQSKYLASGEKTLQTIIQQCKSAKKFIFMEYFIIRFGQVWEELLEVLKTKAQEGVDVRLIYDDWGCYQFDKDYVATLRGYGIKIYSFNEINHKFVVQMNNRSHRKICIVDGELGIISGANIADEYANITSPYGHWKDNGVMIKGLAVFALIDMFLVFWSYCSKDPKESLESYKTVVKAQLDDGLIQPFADNPSDDLTTTESVHISSIYQGNQSIVITTPYLIIGHEMIRTLTQASLSGVRVDIVVPGIADKKMVNMVTKSNYKPLLEAGVNIYEYTPGFIHQKTLLVDNKLAIISSANMDYRSYYLNFECGICFYDSSVIYDVSYDLETIKSQSRKITLEEVENTPFMVKFARAILSLFAGLL